MTTAAPGRNAAALASNPDLATLPAPEYVLRGHEAQVNTVSFGGDQTNPVLFSGDADGYVVVWSLKSFRPLAFFKAHSGSVLTVTSWASSSRLLTHGRDNKIHAFDLSAIISSPSSSSSSLPSISNPTQLEPLFTFETNAIGYCKCSVLEVSSTEALVAVPSTLDDNLVDIFHLPSTKRIHRSIGKEMFDSKTGTVMSISLFKNNNYIHVLVAYEDGRIALFSHLDNADYKSTSLEENFGWTKAWEMHEHKEPVMGLCVDAQRQTAWSVSADHLVVRYNLFESPCARVYKTAYPGRGAVAVRQDGRILTTAGWDGHIRVHSAASFKPLAMLDYHRESLYALAFQQQEEEDGEKDRGQNKKGLTTTPWLAGAGADGRISLWKIFPVSDV